jgi:Flp pilus assembly protein TadG
MNSPQSKSNKSFALRTLRVALRKVRFDQSGQVLPMVAVMMVGLLGMSGMVMDVGRVYISYHELQSATDAAAMAGAQALPGSGASTMATAYSAVSGDKNSFSNLSNVQMVSGYPLVKCLSTLTAEGVACVSPANGNAIQVKQQVIVPMYFAALLGTSSVTLTASATASMSGAITTPYNVVIIVDSTVSMGTQDSGDCNASRLSCALTGVQTLLHDLSPCGASQATCGTATNGNVSNAVDRVALYTFPNVTDGTASADYDCSSSDPTTEPYTFPSTTATVYSPTTYTYRIVPFQTDYRTSDTTASLNTASNLTLAVNGKSGCTGITNPGGQGTYYAGALYAAQADLLHESAEYPGSQNVIILLSDGDSTATGAHMGSGYSSTSGAYPSTLDQCQQAITAAQAIAATGTKIYSVAYGAASSGCSTDTTGTLKGLSPCTAMQKIASSPAYFFSDYTATQNSGQCISASQPTTSLNQIFTQIAGSFTAARLIPDATP